MKAFANYTIPFNVGSKTIEFSYHISYDENSKFNCKPTVVVKLNNEEIYLSLDQVNQLYFALQDIRTIDGVMPQPENNNG